MNMKWSLICNSLVCYTQILRAEFVFNSLEKENFDQPLLLLLLLVVVVVVVVVVLFHAKK